MPSPVQLTLTLDVLQLSRQRQWLVDRLHRELNAGNLDVGEERLVSEMIDLLDEIAVAADRQQLGVIRKDFFVEGRAGYEMLSFGDLVGQAHSATVAFEMAETLLRFGECVGDEDADRDDRVVMSVVDRPGLVHQLRSAVAHRRQAADAADFPYELLDD